LVEEKQYDMKAIIDRIIEAKSKEPEPDYDIEASVEQLGYLDPLKVDALGRLIDGAHRTKVAENWPAFQLDHIDTDEKYLIAMFTSNYHRRQMSSEEKTAVLDGIAEITGWTPKEMAEHLSVSERTVSRYLSDEYKDAEMQRRRQKREEKKEELKEPCVDSLSTEKEAPESAEKTEKKKTPSPPKPARKITFKISDEPEDPKSRLIEDIQQLGLIIPANHPAILALTKFCYEKEIHWHSVVEQALTEFLKREGYLE
jgi:predicted transcriptional regulator